MPEREELRLSRRFRSLLAQFGPSAAQNHATIKGMSVTLFKALVGLLPACILFSGSVVLFFLDKTVATFLQLLGAGCLVVVVVTHVFEALRLIPWMNWGMEHSIGHYIDFVSAILGVTLFPAGYLLMAVQRGTYQDKAATPSRLDREGNAV